MLVEFARDDNNKRTSCRSDNQRLLIFQKQTFKELYTGIPSDNGVIVLYLQTVANIYSNSDLCYNKNESYFRQTLFSNVRVMMVT